MSPSPNWYGIKGENGEPEYHWFDGGDDAHAWEKNGEWTVRFSLSLDGGTWRQVDLGPNGSGAERPDGRRRACCLGESDSGSEFAHGWPDDAGDSASP